MTELKSKTPKKEIVKKKSSSKVSIKKKSASKSKISKISPVKKTVKKRINIVKEEPKKSDKWYIWLKNNIIENEKEMSRTDKNRRLKISVFAIFCFIVVLLSTSIIDYSTAMKNDSEPLFVIKIKNNHKQATIYYGTFYKAWKCDNGESTVIFGRYNSELGYCKLEPKYDVNGIYTNPYGVRITKSQMNIIKNYYFDDFINIKNDTELVNAYKISTALNNIWWVKTKSETVLNNDSSIELAIFGRTYMKDGIETWELQYTDTNYYKCVKLQDDKYVFSTYNAYNKTCGNDWKALTLDSVSCELAKNDTEFISKLVTISKLCK